MASKSKTLYRYRVVSVSGPEIAKVEVGAVLVDRHKPEGKDAEFPNGYYTWTFVPAQWDGSNETAQYVTGEFIGTRFDDRPGKGEGA